MSDLKDRFSKKCRLQIQELPKHWVVGGQRLHYCPLAVKRLKAIKALRSTGSEVSEKEESELPGCPYAIKSQMSGYCSFVYEARFMSDIPMADSEIAAILDISIDQVRLAADSAMAKIQGDSVIIELKKSLDGESILEERLSLEDEHIHFD